MSSVTLGDIERYGEAALAALPDPFRGWTQDIVLRVEEVPAADLLADLDCDDAMSLTGMYDGVPVPLKSVSDPSRQPDVIWLFRQPILQEWRDRGNLTLQELVRHIVVHEVAHHFGWSDDDIARVDRWWE